MAILRRLGLGKPAALEAKPVVVRYERQRPRELIPIDSEKQLGSGEPIIESVCRGLSPDWDQPASSGCHVRRGIRQSISSSGIDNCARVSVTCAPAALCSPGEITNTDSTLGLLRRRS